MMRITRIFPIFTILILITSLALTMPRTISAASAQMQIETGSVTSQVSASADDAEEPLAGGTTDLNSSDLELGADLGVDQWVGMRFNTITVPPGASISSAYVEFEVDETGSDPTSVLIQGQAVDNAPTFANVNNDLTSRDRTVAQVPWNDIPPWTVTSVKWQTPNLSSIIQEIVNRPGWASGNSIAILISGTGRRTAEAYDGEIPAAPKLIIQYVIGNTSTPDPNATATFTPTVSNTPTPSNTPTATATASPSPTATRSQTPGPSPTSAPGSNIRFAIIGDFGDAGTAERDVANLVKSWNPEFVITTGDNTYSSSIDQNIGQYYHEFIYPYNGSYGAGASTNRFFPSIGNHDWDESNGQIYFNYFVLPGNERYYDYVRGPVHFFVIDSDTREPDGTSSSSAQALWLQAALAASSSPWNIVYFHHPPYSSSSASSYMRWPYQAWGADIVIAGHRHNYERIMLNGFPYIINGLGGSTSIHSFGTPVTGSVVRYNSDFGAMLANASSSGVTFQFITRTGAVIDTLSLGTTGTPTSTATRTATPTRTNTPTATVTRTPTNTGSPTFTLTNTATPTPGPSPTATGTPTSTPTATATFTPSQTFTPSSTATPSRTATSTMTATATLPPSSNPLYASFTSSGSVGGVSFSDEDILKFDGSSWSMLFDGSDVGVSGTDVFAFSVMDADTFLMAFDKSVTIGSMTFAPTDIARFDATSLGSVTAGTFGMYLNGIDVGLDMTAENIDSVSLLPDGRVLLSTTGSSFVPGVTGADEDVLAFTPTTLGTATSGTWAMYFDGSDVGLADASSEDVDALDADLNGNIYLSTTGNFAVTGVSGFDEDVFVCSPTSLGSVTACSYFTALYFDGSTWGLSANDVDAFNFLGPPTP